MRTRRKINLLEITTGITAVSNVSITANVGPVTLNDGEFYDLELFPGVALPTGLTGAEAFDIAVANNPAVTVQVCDRRARNVLSERVKRYRVIRLLYTESSVITQGTSTPVFVAVCGIERLV